jgi:hypothetical protein
MFSGGSYPEVARWLRLFLNSHAKRESPRVEASVDDEREAVYVVFVRDGDRASEPVELDAKTVAEQRGSLAWCVALAAQVRRWAREVLTTAPPSRERPSDPSTSRSGPGRPGATG